MKSRIARVLRLIVLTLCLPLVLVMAAFNASAQISTGYNVYQQPMPVVKATVVGVRSVQLSAPTPSFGTNQMVGTAIGGLLGGLIGQASKSFAVAGVAGALGSVAGGYASSHVGSPGATGEAQEVILRKDDGQMIAVTQAVADGVHFAVGQSVIIIGTGRIAPAI